MYRWTVAFALAATASAQVELTSEASDGQQRLMARRQVVTDITDFETRINLNLRDAVANAQIQAERAASNATIAATATMYNQLQAIQQNNAVAQAAVNAQISSLTANVDAALAASSSRMDAQISTLTATMSTQLSTAMSTTAAQASTAAAASEAGLSRATATAEAGVSRATAAVATGVGAIASCSARGQYYNGTACVSFSPVLVRNTATTCNVAGSIKVHPTSGKIEVCDGQRYKASLPTVSHRGYTSSNGCENCYPNHRDISFRKHYADTYIRVMWYDNTRMYGWGGRRGAWHLRVCDANGNGCADCNDPGQMMSDKYTWAEHGWRVNLHHPQQVTALCRRTTNRQLNPGQYKIRLWLASSHDAYTGHHNQYGSIQVEEVYKA